MGLGDPVDSLASLANGDIVAGGRFLTAGSHVSAYLARLTTTCPATATPYGTGCTGSAGPLTLTSTQLPWIGSSYRATAAGLAANGLAFDLLGWTSTALPLASLHPAGSPGCSLLVDPVANSLLVPTGGSASVQFVVPNAASFVGITLHNQVVQLEFDLQLNLLGITSTNGIAFTIGSF